MKTLPPISAALQRTHTALMRDLCCLEFLVAPPSSAQVDELLTRLASTLSHVMQYFRLEEKNGYMIDVRQLEPRLESPVDDLREEHRCLKDSLSNLIVEAAGLVRIDDEFSAKVRAWIARVHQHQRRENNLVQDAFEVEIGGEA